MNFYDLITNAIQLYVADIKNRLEFGLPIIAGSYSMVMGIAVDFGLITLCLGCLAGIMGVIEKGFKIKREYIALKLENAKAEKEIKILEDKDSSL
jgi:hypothetical protein